MTVVKTVGVVKVKTQTGAEVRAAMCGGLRDERHVEWGTAGAPALEHLPLPLVLELLLPRPLPWLLPLSLALSLHLSPSLAVALHLSPSLALVLHLSASLALAGRLLDPPPVLQ